MPFCPVCHSEFKTDAAACSECDEPLVVALAPENTENMDDVYLCYEPDQADRVVDILQNGGLDALLRDRSSTMFPLNVGMMAERVVAVPHHQGEEARALIREAILDGVIPTQGGEFVGMEHVQPTIGAM